MIKLLNKNYIKWRIYYLLLIWLTGCNAATAATATIQVMDQAGNPVPNAVLSAKTSRKQFTSDVIAVMDQVNKQFAPHVVLIERGQQVAFPNSDDIRHHVYSFSEPKPFEIKMYKGGESQTLLFNKAGIVVLGCNIHDQMVGYIYVSEAESSVITDEQGLAELELEGGTFSLWHARLSVSQTERQQFSFNPGANDKQVVTVALLPVKSRAKKHGFKPRFGNEAK